jgi:tRNA G18 (ribose-2'-O)-methylase SpoU
MELYLLLENIQYAKNVASIFRTAEAFAVKKIFLSGISHTPSFGKNLQKASRKKELRVPWQYIDNAGMITNKMKKRDFQIIGVEITDESVEVAKFIPNDKILLIVGNEVYGITQNTLDKLDGSIHIPMYGKGSSLSVGVACGVALNNIINNYNVNKNKN